MKENIKYAINYYKRKGFLSLLHVILARLGIEFLNGTLVFLILDLNKQSDDFNGDACLSIQTIKDIESDVFFDEGFFSKRKTINRIEQGKILFAAKDNFQTYFTLWIEHHNLIIWWFNDTQMVLPKDAVYMSGVYTAASYRHQGIATKLKREAFHYLRNQGIKYVIEAVHPQNTIALLMDKRLGFQECFNFNYKKVFLFRHYNIQFPGSKIHKSFFSIFRTPSAIKRLLLTDIFCTLK